MPKAWAAWLLAGLGAVLFGPREPANGLAATDSGLGLASLRQRIELVHGTLRASGTPDGGFCVEATMPSYVPTAEPAM